MQKYDIDYLDGRRRHQLLSLMFSKSKDDVLFLSDKKEKI